MAISFFSDFPFSFFFHPIAKELKTTVHSTGLIEQATVAIMLYYKYDYFPSQQCCTKNRTAALNAIIVTYNVTACAWILKK